MLHPELTLPDLVKEIISGRVSSTKLVNQCLDSIESTEADLHAYIPIYQSTRRSRDNSPNIVIAGQKIMQGF